MSQKFHRRVIQVSAYDSPNVRRAVRQIARGQEPDGVVEVPGVLTYEELQARLATWDAVRVQVGIHAKFPEGLEFLLYPPQWLAHAERLAEALAGERRQGVAIGCDPGEGSAATCWSVVDRRGLINLLSLKTPDTSVIPGETLALMREFCVPASRVVFDRGGGGKQIADRLRAQGHAVRTVGFGEAVTQEPGETARSRVRKVDQRETRYQFYRRRDQLYGELSELLDPSGENKGFAIPAQYQELLRQLSLVPRVRDDEGRLKIPPKTKRDPKSNARTLTEIMGRSPDELDSFALAVHGMLHEGRGRAAGFR